MAELIISIIVTVTVFTAAFAVFYFLNFASKEKELFKAETEKNNYKTVSYKANDIIVTIDILNGQILNVNETATRMIGYEEPELLKKTIYDIIPPEYLDKSSKKIAEVWDKKGLVYEDIPFITAGGEMIDVESSAKVLVYNNRPVIVIYARDIRERLRLQNEILEQNELLEQKNQNILDSINYASRIQRAILGDPEKICSRFSGAFICFQPHSIVSGDFYWFYENGDYKIIIAADCTGHGVPGAFMTVMGHDFLESIIVGDNIFMPDKILYKLDIKVSNRLKNEENSENTVYDGMDIAILTFEKSTKKVYFSGAKNPLYYTHNNEIHEIKGSINTIGGYVSAKEFTCHEVNYTQDTLFYIFSDGFQDQFGGENKRKYLRRNFRNFLLSISQKSLQQQHALLKQEFETWKGDLHQTDDILIIGIKF